MRYIDADKLIAEIERRKEKPGITFRERNILVDIETSIARLRADMIISSLQQEKPKFNVGDLVVSKKNPHLTYKILATNIPNELGKTDYKVEIFTDGKPGLLSEPHNIHLISSDKIEDWGELVLQERPEVDLEKLGGIARHLISVKDHEEDMRLDESEWLLLERIGYPERYNAKKEVQK